MKKKETKVEAQKEVIVLIHPMARGYNRRATEDWQNKRVKVQGNILLPDGQEARPAGAYKTIMNDELLSMMQDSIVVAGSKVMISPKL